VLKSLYLAHLLHGFLLPQVPIMIGTCNLSAAIFLLLRRFLQDGDSTTNIRRQTCLSSRFAFSGFRGRRRAKGENPSRSDIAFGVARIPRIVHLEWFQFQTEQTFVHKKGEMKLSSLRTGRTKGQVWRYQRKVDTVPFLLDQLGDPYQIKPPVTAQTIVNSSKNLTSIVVLRQKRAVPTP
jgi:hypothetical protein